MDKNPSFTLSTFKKIRMWPSVVERESLEVHWKDWCWNWNSNTLATSCEELTRWKRPWWWEGLRAGGEGDDRGWDDWMASPTRWTWVWVNSRSWWWTGRPGMLRFMGPQRVRHNWATELNWWRFCTIFFKRRQTHAHRGAYKLTISYNKGFLSDLNSLLLYLKKGKVSRSWI